MRNLQKLLLAASVLSILLLLTASTPTGAQTPRYLHALSNLRMARAWLQADGRPQYAAERHRAIDEIDRAIGEIKHAARDDGKNLNFQPPPSSGGNPSAPLHSAMKLLDEARQDIADTPDQPGNVGLQVRALQHIDGARSALQPVG